MRNPPHLLPALEAIFLEPGGEPVRGFAGLSAARLAGSSLREGRKREAETRTRRALELEPAISQHALLRMVESAAALGP